MVWMRLVCCCRSLPLPTRDTAGDHWEPPLAVATDWRDEGCFEVGLISGCWVQTERMSTVGEKMKMILPLLRRPADERRWAIKCGYMDFQVMRGVAIPLEPSRCQASSPSRVSPCLSLGEQRHRCFRNRQLCRQPCSHWAVQKLGFEVVRPSPHPCQGCQTSLSSPHPCHPRARRTDPSISLWHLKDGFAFQTHLVLEHLPQLVLRVPSELVILCSRAFVARVIGILIIVR